MGESSGRTRVHRILRKMSQNSLLLPATMVLTGAVALFGGMLIRGETLFWGTPLLQFGPWREFSLRALRDGYLPLWNPLLGMGAPLLANYQSALLYPPTWVQMLVGVAWGQGLMVFLHVIWAGVGMSLLARKLGLSALGQCTSAMAFSLSGYVIARAGFLSINSTVAWLPWLLLAGEIMLGAIRDGLPLRSQVLALLSPGVVLGFQWLAGHAQTAWYSLVIFGAWLLWRASGVAWQTLGRAAIGLLANCALGFLLACGQLIPTIEYLLHSFRASSVDPDLAFLYSFSPIRIFGLFAPDLLGTPAGGNYQGFGNFWEDAIYIGVLPVLLALSAGIRGLRDKGKRARSARLLVLLAGVGVLLGLGQNTPIFPWLFEHVPTFSMFQAPTRWTLLTVLALSLLAGYGADEWRQPEERGLYWTRLGTAGAGAIAVTAALALNLLDGPDVGFVRAFLRAGLLLALAGILSLAGDRIQERIPRGWPWIIGAFILIDLVQAGAGLNPSTPIDLYRGQSDLVSRVGREHRMYMPSEIEYELKFDRFFRFDTFYPGESWRQVRRLGIPNVTLLEGIPSANNFDPLLPARYARWMAGLEDVQVDHQTRLLELMDVEHYALRLSQDGLVEYGQVPQPARVRLVSKAEVVSGTESAYQRVLEEDFDPNRVVLLERDSGHVGLGPDAEAKFLRLQDLGPNQVQVEVDSSGGGWLVLSDLWYPGWRAELDGETIELFRADYLFRAVHVPPGRHLIRFKYFPAHIVVGMLMSLIAWISVVGLRWRL